MAVADVERKVALCFQEMEMCWSLIESRRGDDFMARLLSIYITMRVDEAYRILQDIVRDNPLSELAQECLRDFELRNKGH